MLPSMKIVQYCKLMGMFVLNGWHFVTLQAKF